MLHLFDLNETIIARAFIAPQGGKTVTPGMEGVVIDRDEIVKRHKIRFANGREVWVTSDQVIAKDPKTKTEPAQPK